MHRCDPLQADIIIDDVPYQLSQLAEFKAAQRLGSLKVIVLINAEATYWRLRKARLARLRERQRELRLGMEG